MALADSTLAQKFATASLSSRGGRRANEDWTAAASAGGASCWVVADGLGGHGGGAEAARTACEEFAASFAKKPGVTPANLRQHMEQAHAAVQRRQMDALALRQMRTTLVALVADESSAVWGHVGDSRLYHMRGGAVAEQTRDHSVPQSLADAGLIQPHEVRHHVDRNRLLRALGEESRLEPQVRIHPLALQPDDAFLLCTDGFWEPLDEAEMEADLSRSQDPAQWLRWMERRMLERVRGAFDNYTAVAITGNHGSGSVDRGVAGGLG